MCAKLFISIFNLFCYLVIFSNAEEKFFNVKIHNGVIRGVKKWTVFENKEYIAFLGIPYAKPPLGNLRFLPPVRPDNWTGILDTTDFGSRCTQLEYMHTEVTGSEDCLFINVYMPVTNSSEPLPVMFYSHGGGFYEGTSDTELNGPDYLLEKDVILVTSNFRLSIFGFLSLGDDVYSGNMGLKDALMALQWTNENIGFFNGDSRRITIFGHSSGATMVHLMTISPTTRGLFQRAIILASSAINIFSINVDSKRDKIFKFVKNERDVESYEDVIQFLQTCESEKLLSVIKPEPEPAGRRGIILFYAPTIESKNAITPFLIDYPENVLELERPRDIDIMFGLNEYETLSSVANELYNPTLLEPFNEQFEFYLPNIRFDLDYNSSEYRQMANEVREFYFGVNGTVNQKSYIDYMQLMSDVIFTYGIHRSAINSVHHVTGKTYYFRFMVDAKLNVLKHKFGLESFPGIIHGDELGYIFKSDRFSNVYLRTFESDSIERKTIDRMTSFLTNFAKYGNPSPNDIPVKWLPVTEAKQNYLKISNYGTSPAENPNSPYNTFWDNLFERYQNYSRPPVRPTFENKIGL